MRGRARLGALGLRGRIVGVVLATTVATLGVAAATLLGPLNSSLRSAARATLIAELRGSAAVAPFQKLPLYQLPSPTQAGADARSDLTKLQSQLAQRIGGLVAVLGYPDTTGQGRPLLPLEHSPLASDPFSDADQVFLSMLQRNPAPRYSFGSLDGTEYARAALPFTQHGIHYVLAVRRTIGEIPRAAGAVRTAFLVAAAVALALTLILAIPLSGTVVRRLRLLRQAALRVAQEGPAVEIPVDRARDEVGDLARTFALMQQQLRRQEEARRAFVATASHELRTPVASLDGLLELLDEDLQAEQADLEDARSLLSRARGQSRRLGRLAADLLDLSRIDAQTELRSEPVELGELSRAVMAEFELGTSRRGIITVLDDSAGSVWALGDPGSVARILRILLDNAVRLSPEGGRITVELRNGQLASLSVCDRGPGVPGEERELIFERFMRGREAGGKAGFGLGLAIGRELAHRMGGELVLEDQPPPGARFTLRLPVTRAPQEETVALA